MRKSCNSAGGSWRSKNTMAIQWTWNGQGWRYEPAISRAGAPGDRAVRQSATSFKTYSLNKKGKSIVTGAAIGEAISTGNACLIQSAKDINRFREGRSW